MTLWFHRNPFKATTNVKFDIPMIVANVKSIEICDNLKKFRLDLLELFKYPTSDLASTDKCFNNYLRLILGFITNDLGQNDHKINLRNFIKFKWTQSLLGNDPIVYQDVIFEIISLCQEYAIWLMKHASVLVSNVELKEDQAKIVYKSLKKAASLFKYVEDNYFNELDIKPTPASDLDPKISNVYIQQCLAEAQEVTITRAIDLKHSPILISALCFQTSKIFLNAAICLKEFDQKVVGKWMKYLNLKASFYEAYAYNYNGENLLNIEKCGEAIKSMMECEKIINLITKLTSEYMKAKGVGQSINPSNCESFSKMISTCKRTKEKCERENIMIFHQKVPEEPVILKDKATHGLVTIDKFDFPEISPLWCKEVYDSFYLSTKDKDKKVKKEKKDKKEKKEKDKKDKDEKSKEKNNNLNKKT